MEKEKTFYTMDEVCEILSICRSQVSKLIEVEGFPAVKNNKSFEIDKKKFEQWLADNMGKTIPIQNSKKKSE